MKRLIALAIAAAGLLGLAPPASAEDTLLVPVFSYRTGPFATSGIPFVNGIADYLNMLNARDGGVGGAKVAVEECETGYDTKKGIECYDTVKSRGPLVYTPLSTGITLALLPHLAEDKVPILTIAYGLTAAARGDFFPWAFNPPDTYWDTMSGILQYVAEKEGGLDKLKGKTIGYTYLDSPYGKEPIPVLEQLSKTYGFTVKYYPVAGSEMQNQSSQWLNVRRDKPDWMLMFGWGAMHPTALKEAAKIGFPMDHFIGNYFMADEYLREMGDAGKGFRAIAWHASGDDFPAFADIRKLLLEKGLTKTTREQMGTALYNHGVHNSVMISEAIRNAQRMTGKKMVTGADVRRGFEVLDITPARLKELGLPNFAGATKLSCTDHNGHGPLFMQYWDGTKWAKASEPREPMHDIVNPMLDAAARDYVEKNTGWPKRTEPCDKPV